MKHELMRPLETPPGTLWKDLSVVPSEEGGCRLHKHPSSLIWGLAWTLAP